ncbi:hypothetical protein MKZ38_009619 [Zalerion maritima]|uniref:UCH catalytic domain-containing protein n=1 Tax=Zalerion maritima TaxID=339359 RepID=A0AAD5RG41_9PEZI|nr:hypothetical protein MKZ38_009619 [Zalerion maritima]
MSQFMEKCTKQGDTAPPESPEEEVDFHYVCFVNVKSGLDGIEKVFLLDGDRQGPVHTGVVLSAVDDDMISEKGLEVVREFMRRAVGGEGCEGGDGQFSLLALAPA